MLQLSFAKDIKDTDSYHQLDEEEILSIALTIIEKALSERIFHDTIHSVKEYLESKGANLEQAVITSYDIDYIELSFTPKTTSEPPLEVSIRTWDIHADWEENPDSIQVDWTFHIFGDFPDMPPASRRVMNDTSNGNGILIDGSDDILVGGDYYGLDSIGNDTGFEQLTKDELDRLLAAVRSGNGGRRALRWYQIWFQATYNRPDLCGIDETDDEMRVLAIIKNSFKGILDDRYHDDIFEFVSGYISDKFRHEWYKNYLGTKKITFDGPTKYKETGEITDEDISAFMSGAWNNFLNYRLKVGHTERQDRFTAFMRDYPQEILDWMRDGWNNEVIPYYFYEGLAKGGEYELYGCSKDEFINILRSKDFDDLDEEFEYAAVLEEVFGIDFAVDYLMVLNWNFYYEDYSIGWVGEANPTIDFIINTLKKAINNNNNEKALKSLAYFYMAEDDEYYPRDLSLSIKLMSRLSTLWKKSIISDDWLTGPYGLAYIVDFEWGDDFWEEDEYPECPDEDVYRIWLIKLLESDFAEDIADYLKPLLEMVLEREKNHNWETGKKAIEAFLAKTSNK